MAAELSSALTWTLDNVKTYGGDPGQACACLPMWP